MKRVQDALFEQLSKYKSKLELDIREREEESRKTIGLRENIGVELYNFQQNLAQSQAMQESAEDSLNVIQGMREEAERQLKHSSNAFNDEQQKITQANQTCIFP
jgi:hypothetical protein